VLRVCQHCVHRYLAVVQCLPGVVRREPRHVRQRHGTKKVRAHRLAHHVELVGGDPRRLEDAAHERSRHPHLVHVREARGPAVRQPVGLEHGPAHDVHAAAAEPGAVRGGTRRRVVVGRRRVPRPRLRVAHDDVRHRVRGRAVRGRGRRHPEGRQVVEHAVRRQHRLFLLRQAPVKGLARRVTVVVHRQRHRRHVRHDGLGEGHGFAAVPSARKERRIPPELDDLLFLVAFLLRCHRRCGRRGRADIQKEEVEEVEIQEEVHGHHVEAPGLC